jgi:beta-galactosidase
VDRRNFLKASTLTAGATLLPNVLARAYTAQGLRTVPMNRGWRFSPKVVEGDTRREFDDTAFTRVVILHTNKVLPWHSFDDKEYEFISTYCPYQKLHLSLPITPFRLRNALRAATRKGESRPLCLFVLSRNK